MSSNKRENNISHRGRVVEITPELTSVEIISEAACASCHAKGLCGLGESKSKLVQLPTSPYMDLAPGDEVEVLLSASMGHKAVWIAYVIPCFLLIAVLLILNATAVGELASGLGAIASVLVYYFVVWLFRGRLRNEYIFKIKK
ncbi:MAG: SoxR reducing system RseC family protein [Candidatus Cryptobacteroides sp.]|nr:SoxR reducing system RseC family protein [Rikenellaceae bacterium]MDY5747171.1 SoxR reducing system RseC family protein [Candidatus Cryptobacteroides sp.]